MYHKIVFLVGAGISVAAGYPTFRNHSNSEDNPAQNLSNDSAPHQIASALLPFSVEESPTDFHKFMSNYATRIYTQNIDRLEYISPHNSNVDPTPTIIPVHGQLRDGATCRKCSHHIPWSVYQELLKGDLLLLPPMSRWCLS